MKGVTAFPNVVAVTPFHKSISRTLRVLFCIKIFYPSCPQLSYIRLTGLHERYKFNNSTGD